MERAYADLTRLEGAPPCDVVFLRALEAGSAAAYFRAWRAVPLKWTGMGRRPIPASWQMVGLANVALQTGRQSKRRAPDQRNAELRLCRPRNQV